MSYIVITRVDNPKPQIFRFTDEADKANFYAGCFNCEDVRSIAEFNESGFCESTHNND